MWRSLDTECVLGLAAVPEPGCQATGRQAYEEVGWRLEPSYCRQPEAFLREPKLNSQSTKALHKMLEEAQGKTGHRRSTSVVSGLPYLPTWLPRFCGKAELHTDPAAAEKTRVHMETNQAALDCMHLLDSRTSGGKICRCWPLSPIPKRITLN